MRRMAYGRDNDRGMDFGPKPVKVGDELDLTVEAVAAKGDGIAKKDGFVIFIRGGQMGQTYKIRITELKARSAIGEIASGSAPAAAEAPAAVETPAAAEEAPAAEDEPAA